MKLETSPKHCRPQSVRIIDEMKALMQNALPMRCNGDNPMLMPTRLLSMFARARVLGA